MNNNEMEFDFLNDSKTKSQKEEKKDFSNVFLIVLKMFGYILYGLICGLCGFIEIIATLFLIKGVKPKKRKRRR